MEQDTHSPSPTQQAQKKHYVSHPNLHMYKLWKQRDIITKLIKPLFPKPPPTFSLPSYSKIQLHGIKTRKEILQLSRASKENLLLHLTHKCTNKCTHNMLPPPTQQHHSPTKNLISFSIVPIYHCLPVGHPHYDAHKCLDIIITLEEVNMENTL